MKWVIATLIGFILVLSEVTPSLSQTASTETEQALSPNESTELRLQIKALTELLQAKVPKEQQHGQQQSNTSAPVYNPFIIKYFGF